MRGPVAAVAFAAITVGCGPAPHSRGAGAVLPLTVRAVAWNPSNTAVGKVRAVADDGDVVAVFSDRGATVFSARAPVATDHAVTDWQSATAIAGADGAARWIVGITGKGRIYYLRGLSTFEDVTDRYGLGSARLLGASPLGGRFVGFLLGRELGERADSRPALSPSASIAIADGAHVTRYAGSANGATFDELAGGAGFGAVVEPNGVRVFDAARKSVAFYPLPGAAHAALGGNGRLYATTARAVYAADSLGRLALVYDARGDTIHGLAVSGSEAWFADGDELGVVSGDRVAETSGANVGREAKLAPSASGDVWVLSGGALGRFARAESGSPAGGGWGTDIAPIFARSCSACHQPDGVSGTDLSTAAAWEGERAHIRERVVETRSMPPEGHPLSESDRAAVQKWLAGG